MSRLGICLLGTVRLELNGAPISLGYHKAVALVAYLAVTQQMHTRQTLATLLWPNYDPASARREMRRILWVLNRSLGSGWLEIDHQLVGLLPRSEMCLDVDRFRELLALCNQHDHVASEVCPACREPLMEAVALVRGDFMAGFTLPDSPDFDIWQTFETESLRRELAGALERLVQLLIRFGEINDQTIVYARRWLALDPLYEPAQRQLIQLYSWLGQPAAALRQYQDCVHVLKAELDASPADETKALYEAIKANRLLPPSQVAAPGDSLVDTSKRSQTQNQSVQHGANLPAPPTPFIGRQQEVTTICQLLTQETPQVRLITLTGPGGTGKTRLGLQVATELLDHFADGVFFVPLAGLGDPQLLVSEVARHLDMHADGSQPALQILLRVLQEKHVLLVLDNFEQIITAAPVIAELLTAAPRLRVLMTSREVLNLRGEYEFLVPPLKLPDRSQTWSLEELQHAEAVQLFVERARATSAGFTLTADNVPIVAEICHRLDGLPLAIELAAARVRLLPPPTLLSRLSSRLKVLTGGPRDMPTRQQTLRNTLDWSYSLMDPAEQALFSCLAVFVGGFTLETAESICNANGFPPEEIGQELDVMEGITSLLNKSLLTYPNDSDGQPRFRMLETIREYALERLEERGQLETLQRQHACYFATQLDQIGLHLDFYSGRRLDWAEEEHDNIRAMLAWSLVRPDEAELGLRMMGVLYWFWYRRGYASEGREWCQRFLNLTSETRRTLGRASFLMGSGSLALWQGDLAEAEQRLQEGIAICRELGDEQRLAMTLLGSGVLALYQGNAAKAQATFEESLSLGERLDLWWIVADSLLNLANVAVARGDYAAARQWLEQAATVAKCNDEVWLVANVLNNLGEVARIQGDYEQARCSYEECQNLFRAMEAKSDIARSLHNLGHVTQHQGDYKRAAANFRESLSMFQELGNKRGMAEGLAGLAGLAAAQGREHTERAGRLLAAAEAQIRTLGASWWPADQVEFERNLALIRATLDPETFATTWRRGQSMSLTEAIAEALD